MSEEFEEGLRKSKSVVGPIYPVIVEKGTMEIVDGRHRKRIDPTWPEQERTFRDKKSKALFRIHANYRQSVSRKETETNLLMLASYLEDEGVKAEEIASRLTEITPYHFSYINRLLPKKYKQVQYTPKVRLCEATKFVKEKFCKQCGIFTDAPVELGGELLCEVCARSELHRVETSLEGPLVNVDKWLNNYAEAVKSIKSLKPDETARISRLKNVVHGILNEEVLTCPECGEKKICWKCGHDF